ncbi:ABC transporter permease [Nonomuraea pusilla]|uniref:ABC transporter permease n=1 Tax=Nonomuraea pusilla TaxID=46177 RepID=UPI00331C5665
MRTVFLASLRTHIPRYVSAAIAVAVAFVVVVGVLTSGAHSGLMDGLGAPYRNADHVVSAARWPSSELDAQAAIAFTERHGENAAATGRASLPVRANGRRLPEATVGPVATSEEWRWQKLSSGRFPAGTGEAVADVYFASAENIEVGDRVRIGEGAAARDVRVVGLVLSPSPPASMYVTWPQLLQWRDHLHLTAVAVRGEAGQLPEGAKAQPPEGFTAERLTYVQNRVDSLSVMLLLFAGIALFVSVLVIANTFSILFARRLRDFALLRCIGATRRQVVRSVRREAAVVGVLASLTGTLVGIGLGHGLIALINALAPTVPMGAAGLPVLWLLGGSAVGLAVTMVASWLPTRCVVRVSPLAALRPEAAVDAHTATGLVRLALAALLLVTGLVLLGMAMVSHSRCGAGHPRGRRRRPSRRAPRTDPGRHRARRGAGGPRRRGVRTGRAGEDQARFRGLRQGDAHRRSPASCHLDPRLLRRDSARLGGDLDELADATGATVENGLRTWESLDQQLGIYTWPAIGLLGIAVVIALIGIANTLGLSVLERAREHAMLRALGLTRTQLRRMPATEAVLLSVVATLLGTAIGVGFAWVGHETIVKRALRDATMQVPWPSLGVVVLTAALAGLLAAVLPAHRAALVIPAAGLSLD